MSDGGPTKLRYSVSLVTQGDHRFYTLTMPSDVLARTCFVTTRNEDPKQGFQRVLDQDRAQQIADYIDHGFGSIPNSIVLSAQAEAGLRTLGRGKTVEFNDTKKAFLVLDGQHRVFGFSLAKQILRVPVVIYNKLSRQDETRLFIDINTKQRPVPNELLLDIKRLAVYETDQERLLGLVFDKFSDTPGSPLLGLTSPMTRSKGRISRVTFNAGLKTLLPIFAGADVQGIYDALSAYLRSLIGGANAKKTNLNVANPIVFKAIMLLFPQVARRVKDRYGADYTETNFTEVMSPLFERLKQSMVRHAGNSHKALYQTFLKALQTDFTL